MASISYQLYISIFMEDFYMIMILPDDQKKRTRKPNSIELLGYAQNEIVQTIRAVRTLPQEQRDKLRTAYYLLKEVQDYLYHDPLVA